MNINSNYTSIYSFYSNLFDNTMAVYNNKLSSMFTLVNNSKPPNALSAGARLYAGDLKAESADLSDAINELTSGAAWNKKTMTSSDTEAMEVQYSGKAYAMPTSDMSVIIEQLAAGQKNEGARLKANESYGSAGTNKFSIEIAGKKTDISINVAAGDTNKDVQRKMADAINNAGIGLKASVETDSSSKISALVIEATGVGDEAGSKFSIKDVLGGAVAKTGAASVSREAQDAVYNVNGGESKTSKSNTVDLGNGITATFKKASDEAVTITKGEDTGHIVNAVKDLVKGYNELYDTALENAASDPKAMKLLTKLTDIAKNYSDSLSDVGVNVGADGSLSVDNEKLKQSAEDGKLKTFFTENRGSSFGFANQLGKLSNDISRNISNYVSKSVIGDMLTENFGYTSLGELLQYNNIGAGSILDYSF